MAKNKCKKCTQTFSRRGELREHQKIHLIKKNKRRIIKGKKGFYTQIFQRFFGAPSRELKKKFLVAANEELIKN